MGEGRQDNAAKAEREARLAARLRDNLRRRKDQSRAREAPPEDKPAPETPSQD
jgi:hypothetical protein